VVKEDHSLRLASEDFGHGVAAGVGYPEVTSVEGNALRIVEAVVSAGHRANKGAIAGVDFSEAVATSIRHPDVPAVDGMVVQVVAMRVAW